jgi:hypothetical protein
MADQTLYRLSQAAALGIATETFWSSERMAVTFPRENTSAPIPRVTSARQWDKMKTTKLHATLQIAIHLLSSDLAPMPTVKDGDLIIPAFVLPSPNPRTRKILIYQEWSLFLQLLVDVSRCSTS